MPDPEKLLATFRRAIEAFRATPGRKGRLIALADCDEVLVAGDLHGNLGNFQLLMKRAALPRNPRRHLVLQELIHSPFRYPTGGDKSHQLLDLTAALKIQFPRQVHFLLGNHELSQWTECRIEKNLEIYNDLFIQGVRTAYADRADEIYATYLDFFAAAALALRTPNRIFLSHSLPSARRLPSFDPTVLEIEELPIEEFEANRGVHALVWGRDTSPEAAAAFLRKVDAELLITGHIPCEKGFEAPNEQQIILDTMGSSACYCLFPTTRPLTHRELIDCVGEL